MNASDRFTVTISCLNKGLDDQRHKMTGHTLTVRPDGTLTIQGDKGSQTLAPGLWDDLELKMLPSTRGSLADPG